MSGESSAAAQDHLSAREAEKVADAMFALSTPSRVLILSRLRERPHTVGELTEAIGMEQSAVSHQLRVLREHRLVVAERQGRQRVYTLHDEHVASLLDEAIGHVADLSRDSRKRGGASRLRRAG
jgi:DNA-binding transcriptional ArsR family regulator